MQQNTRASGQQPPSAPGAFLSNSTRPLVKLLAACALLLFAASAWAQNAGTAASVQNPQTDSIPTFRATTRVVLVDVVALDNKGQFVTGLKGDDFTVLEDGKPQRLSGFSAHRYEIVANGRATPALALPPNQYTNFTQQEPGGAVTILLFDLLNTSFLDQDYAKKQMLKFLAALPPGQQLALFILGTRLHMVQGFTGKSDLLTAAAKSLMASKSLLVTSEAERQESDILSADVAAFGAPAGHDMAVPLAQAIGDASSMQEFGQRDQRIGLTLRALAIMSQAVSGYSGRKNLLWLSGDFPFRMEPRFLTDRGSHNLDHYISPIRATAALLAGSQVAVYPISLRGLSTTGMDISDQDMATGALQSTTATAMNRQTETMWDEHEAMGDIARVTGGRAFYGTNDLAGAFQRSVREGTNYYTLAYTPSNHDWDGKYRKIEIKATTPKLKLTYREGYYAMPEKQYQGDEASHALVSAMSPETPQTTMLLLRVQVLPPDAEHKMVRIDYALDIHDIHFTDTAEHRKQALVDFMTVAWDKNLKSAGHVGNEVEMNLRPEAYQQALQTGFPLHQELELKPGKYLLRLGVIDRGNQRVGTVDVPLEVPETQTARR